MRHGDITGILLSGGKSSRLGMDKGTLIIKGKPLIDIMYRLMASIFKDVIIITGEKIRYNNIEYRMFVDIHMGIGPLGGLHSGLTHSQTERNFILSVDQPFVNREMIDYLVGYKTSHLITVPEAGGRIQTLSGVYNKKCLDIIDEIVTKAGKISFKNKSFSLYNLLANTIPEVIQAERLPFFHDKMFFNLNTKEDYHFVLRNFDKLIF